MKAGHSFEYGDTPYATWKDFQVEFINSVLLGDDKLHWNVGVVKLFLK